MNIEMLNSQAVIHNFLDPRLLPKVESSAVSMDNYEVSNLISSNDMIKARGFLAYTSIRPPVDIIFELLAPASINFISISSKVGNQQVTGIELYGKNNKSDYVLLGNATFKEPGVIFCNKRYYSIDTRPENTDSNYHLSFLKHQAFRTIINSNKIKIRIFRTKNSVPCLGSVKIVGKISKSCSKITAETIEKLMSSKDLKLVNTDSTDNVAINEHLFDVPEEFKDALTFDIMALPMTLPSGHTVDQTTLEKCLQNDVRYGRHALDPFTGISFTTNKKPVLNISLKSRIDMFLMQNAHRTETYNLKRTVGRKTPIGNSQLASNSSQNLQTENCSTFNMGQKRLKYDNICIPQTGLDSSEMNNILKTLKESSNYISFLNEEEPAKEEIVNKCTNCNVVINLYKLPCKDLYCRMCLLEICNEEVCLKCKKAFKKKDVEKYNS